MFVKQPISLYSHIYSTESKEFKSMNEETLKSIEYIKSIIEKKCTFVCDRGYDANIYYEYFSKKDKEVYVSHTRVELPLYKGTILNLVIVYGLSEQKPMMLLTNKEIKSKKDVYKIVRGYMSRWRIEENFRFKKQQYGFENMRVRTLKPMNVLNTILMMHIE